MEQAETSNLRPRRIISDMNLSREATTEAPTRKAISQRIQRKRKHSEIGHEVAPLNRSGIIIPEKYKTTKRGEEEHRFLLYDNEDDGNDRLIVFSSEIYIFRNIYDNETELFHGKHGRASQGTIYFK